MRGIICIYTCFLEATVGIFSTSAGLKYDRFRDVGEVGGELPLEKLDVEVAELLEARDSRLLELSRRLRGASCVSVFKEISNITLKV